MAHTTVHLPEQPYVKLKERTLWFDGDSCYKPSEIEKALTSFGSKKVFAEELTSAIKQYNKLVPPEEQIQTKKTIDKTRFSLEWNIPKEYKRLNIVEVLSAALEEEAATNDWNMASAEYHKRILRTGKELELYQKLDLFDALRALIFIINTLSERGVVWGVGRGSSVSSYILYLIGVHDVDSVEYQLDIEDFLHE